jgi:carbon-monoxide dehydrogenase large subunit
MDYTMPTAVELPSFEVAHCHTPSPFTWLGTKGAGESGVGGPVAALAAAVEDALVEWGVVIDETPLTPARVWGAVRQAAAGGSAARGSQC